MTDEVLPKLTLGFVGTEEVHRANSLALLRDLVGGFLKQHRKADVEVLLPDDCGDTETLSDIDDWAGTSGYTISAVTIGSMVTELLKEDDARLIIIGHPSDDERLYAVVEEAAKYKIQTRSLLNGLEKVVFEDELDEEELGEGFHEVDLDDPDLDDDLAGEETDPAPDLDILAVLADDGEADAQKEITDIAAAMGIDVTPFETWTDAVASIRGVDADDADDAEVVEEPDHPERTEEAPAEPGDSDHVEPLEELREELGIQAKHTREGLEAMTFDEVKAIGLDHGIAQGRGMKKPNYINRILIDEGIETAADQAKIKRPKKKSNSDVAATLEEKGYYFADTSDIEATITPIRPDEDGGAVLTYIAGILRRLADELES